MGKEKYRTRPYTERLEQLDANTNKYPRIKNSKRTRTNRALTLSCTDLEWDKIMKNTLKVKEFGVKRSEILRKVLLNLTDEDLLYTLGYNINK